MLKFKTLVVGVLLFSALLGGANKAQAVSQEEIKSKIDAAVTPAINQWLKDQETRNPQDETAISKKGNGFNLHTGTKDKDGNYVDVYIPPYGLQDNKFIINGMHLEYKKGSDKSEFTFAGRGVVGQVDLFPDRTIKGSVQKIKGPETTNFFEFDGKEYQYGVMHSPSKELTTAFQEIMEEILNKGIQK